MDEWIKWKFVIKWVKLISQFDVFTWMERARTVTIQKRNPTRWTAALVGVLAFALLLLSFLLGGNNDEDDNSEDIKATDELSEGDIVDNFEEDNEQEILALLWSLLQITAWWSGELLLLLLSKELLILQQWHW